MLPPLTADREPEGPDPILDFLVGKETAEVSAENLVTGAHHEWKFSLVRQAMDHAQALVGSGEHPGGGLRVRVRIDYEKRKPLPPNDRLDLYNPSHPDFGKAGGTWAQILYVSIDGAPLKKTRESYGYFSANGYRYEAYAETNLRTAMNKRLASLIATANRLDEAGFHEEAAAIDEKLKKVAEVTPPPAHAAPAQDAQDAQEVHAQSSWLQQQIDFLNREIGTVNRQVGEVLRSLDPQKIAELGKKLQEVNYLVSQLHSTATDESGGFTKTSAAKRFDVEGAKKEIKAKDQCRIEKETAEKWAGRGLAAVELLLETHDLEWMLRAKDFFHEAAEHSAMVDDEGKTHTAIMKEIKRAEKKIPEKLTLGGFE